MKTARKSLVYIQIPHKKRENVRHSTSILHIPLCRFVAKLNIDWLLLYGTWEWTLSLNLMTCIWYHSLYCYGTPCCLVHSNFGPKGPYYMPLFTEYTIYACGTRRFILHIFGLMNNHHWYRKHCGICSISHNAPSRTEMCIFLFWMGYCGIWNRCTTGFVKLVYDLFV